MDLSDLRKQIDAADDELLAAYIKRLALVEEVGARKRAHAAAVEHEDRERQLLARLTEKFGKEREHDIRFLYGAILSYSKIIQSRGSGEEFAPPASPSENALNKRGLRIACQGVEGAYSHAAAGEMFSRPEILRCETFSEVFDCVSEGKADFGVLPAENSTAGSVNEVYDLLKEHKLRIAAARKLRIDHCLLALSGAREEDIRTVLSHPQALAQCSKYIREKKLSAKECLNTAGAARQVGSGGDKTVAAIASASAAERYGLSVLASGIQNEGQNHTRFIAVAGGDYAPFTGANKLSAVLTLPHRSGSLYTLLNIIAAYGANLTKLESRPIPGTDFEFTFYIDLEGSDGSPRIRELLAAAKAYCAEFVYLGSYPES